MDSNTRELAVLALGPAMDENLPQNVNSKLPLLFLYLNPKKVTIFHKSFINFPVEKNGFLYLQNQGKYCS